jgi:hypothetical protein
MPQFTSDFGYGDEILFRLNLQQSYRGKIVSVEFHKESGIKYGILANIDDEDDRFIWVQENFVFPGNNILTEEAPSITEELIIEH